MEKNEEITVLVYYADCDVVDRPSTNKPELRQTKILQEFSKHKKFKLVKNEEKPTIENLSVLHSVDYINFLQSAYTSWKESDDADWWNGGLVPNHIPYFNERINTVHLWKEIPLYKLCCYYGTDQMSPITEDTYLNACLSAMNSIKAAQAVVDGAKVVYALNCSPGHHATREQFGGYCFFNNAGLAAQYIVDKTKQKVGILDLDYHHGNGQQSLFYNRKDIVTVSIHIDPAFDYPSFTGFTHETGVEEGEGCNKNIPLPPETEDHDYTVALVEAIKYIRDQKCAYLVIPFGADTFIGDPDKCNIAGFSLSYNIYNALGRLVAGLRLPMVITQEGGYNMRAVGEIVSDFLLGCCQQKTAND
jgi:acetoin utilization deacetylase AcuC-like enzyme